jgi:hypothetical protein
MMFLGRCMGTSYRLDKLYTSPLQFDPSRLNMYRLDTLYESPDPDNSTRRRMALRLKIERRNNCRSHTGWRSLSLPDNSFQVHTVAVWPSRSDNSFRPYTESVRSATGSKTLHRTRYS